MTCIVRTGNGVILEGKLTVLSEEDDALIYIGTEFLDDAIRQRYGPSDRAANNDLGALEIDHVRITIEAIEDEPLPRRAAR